MDWNFNGHENRVVHRIKCFHLIHRGSVSKMLSVKRSSNFTIMTPWQEFSLAEINFDLFVSSPTRRFSNEMIYRFHPSLLIEWKLLLFDVWKINFFFNIVEYRSDPVIFSFTRERIGKFLRQQCSKFVSEEFKIGFKLYSM